MGGVCGVLGIGGEGMRGAMKGWEGGRRGGIDCRVVVVVVLILLSVFSGRTCCEGDACSILAESQPASRGFASHCLSSKTKSLKRVQVVKETP